MLESIGIPNGSEKIGGKSEETEEHGGTEESYSYRRGFQPSAPFSVFFLKCLVI